jgi:hypothetical protein
MIVHVRVLEVTEMFALIIAISALFLLAVVISGQFSAWVKDEQNGESVLQHAG